MQAPFQHAPFQHAHVLSSLRSGIEDIYSNDICRTLSLIGFATSEDVIAHLKGLRLGDDFWMYSFKVVPCAKTINHKWTLCPCGHQGETARRRDPRMHPYKANLCPLVKAKKTCPLGDQCLLSHNVFEHWLHPSRYKTRLCTFGHACNRPTCFFAHDAKELRVNTEDEDMEFNEREFLTQFQFAQEAGMMSSKPTYGMSPAFNRAFPCEAIQGHQQYAKNGTHSQSLSGPLPHPTNWRRQQHPVSDTVGNAMVFCLQESMANSRSGGGYSEEASLQPSTLWPGQSQIGRMSDPGIGDDASRMLQRMAAESISVVNPIPNKIRVSDGGCQTNMTGTASGQDYLLAENPPAGCGVGFAANIAPTCSGGSSHTCPFQGQYISVEGQIGRYVPPSLKSHGPSDHIPPLSHAWAEDGGDGVNNDWSLIMRRLEEEVFAPQHQSPAESRDTSGSLSLIGYGTGSHRLLPVSQQDTSDPLIFIGHHNCSNATPGRSLRASDDGRGPAPLTASNLASLNATQDGIRTSLASLPIPAPSSNAYVRQLVTQLQEQGIVNSKEQLIQSLEQLLRQLHAD